MAWMVSLRSCVATGGDYASCSARLSGKSGEEVFFLGAEEELGIQFTIQAIKGKIGPIW